MRKRLQRRGNSLDLRLSPDLQFALGVSVRDGEQDEVEVELVDGGLLIKPVSGVVAESVPPVLATHPSTVELLLAVRDLGPVATGQLAAVLGRVSQSVSDSLRKAREHGWVDRPSTGWVINSTASAWFSHIPMREWPTPERTMRAYAVVPDRVHQALTTEPRPVAELAAELGIDRSQVHHALKRLEHEGRAVSVEGRPVRWRRA